MKEINVEFIKEILKSFYELSGIKASFYDASGVELCYYPELYSDFCRELRSIEGQNLKCAECDKHALAECRKTHKPYNYTCHAGLAECFAPIIAGNDLVGYIALGQARPKNSKPTLTNVDKQTENNLKLKYQKLPAFEKQKIEAAVHILEVCAGYDYLKNNLSLTDAINVRIEQFINQNLDKDLSVNILLSKFHMSRVELYDIFENYFECTVAEYVKKRRLERCCELLKSTKLPVNKICADCGILDYNYFSKIFKKQYGISPSAFRKVNAK